MHQKKLIEDKEFVLEAVKLNNSLEYISNKLLDDKEFILEVRKIIYMH